LAFQVSAETTPPPPASDNPVLQGLEWAASHFIGYFETSGKNFLGLISGILPTLIVLLTAMYAITTWIGEERVTRAVQWSGRYAITRYTLMPVLAVIMLTNPMCYSFGKFLPERQKPAFYDSAVSFVHPVTSFFPQANAGELFVWVGVSSGVLKAAPDKYALLALLYFLVGVVVIFLRGITTEWITKIMIRRTGQDAIFDDYDKAFKEAGMRRRKAGKAVAGGVA
jgi:PTS system glucitol/sorbitol-specific IIC component